MYRFTIDALAYIGFLILYSYVTLQEFESEMSGPEYLLLVWMCIMFLVECHQCYVEGVHVYFSSFWNYNDISIITMYTLAFAFRNYSDEYAYLADAKTVLGLNAFPVYLRLVRFYAASENLGPKVCCVALIQIIACHRSFDCGCVSVSFISKSIYCFACTYEVCSYL